MRHVHPLKFVQLVFILQALACVVCAEDAPARPFLKWQALEEATLKGEQKALHPKVQLAGAKDGTRLTFPAREELPAVQLWAGTQDLGNFDILRFKVNNAGARLQSVVYLQDASGKAAALPFPIDAGSGEIAIPLWSVLKEDNTPLDRSKLTQVRIAIKRQADAATLDVGPLIAQKILPAASKLRFFNFTGAVPFTGATPVRPTDAYTKERGYGISGEGGVSARAWQEFLPLLGSEIQGAAGKVEFKVDLPDGEYEAALVAFGSNWQNVRNVSYKVLANDAPVVDVPVTKENFYTFDNFYYGANLFYNPSKSLFDQYHRKYFEPHRFAVTAKDGAVTLKFEGCGPRALWIYPKSMKADGEALVEGSLAEEGYNVWLRTARVRDHKADADPVAPTDADKARGYQLFARDYQYRVYPNSTPKKEELIPEAGLHVAVAANEFEPLTFAIRPLKDLGVTKITWSEFANGDKKLPPEAFEKFFVKYFPYSVGDAWYEAVPTTLYPYEDRDVKLGWNHQPWVTLRIPAGQAGGDYKGSVTIEPANGQKTVLPVTITVRPFDLPVTKTECGMYNNTAFGHQGLDLWKDAEFSKKMLDIEVRNHVEHGMQCYGIGQPNATNYDLNARKVTLDFSNFDMMAEAIKKNGMQGRNVMGFAGFTNYGLMKRGIKEFSPEFNEMILDIFKQMHEWSVAKKLSVIMMVFDEARETELNDWNRNRQDMLKYLKLLRKVDGLKTVTTLMGDKDGFNRPYTLLLPLLDVVQTHCWAQSDDILFLTTNEHAADLWTYNNGFTRFAHGLYLWKVKSNSHWQWVFSWEVCNAHIPVFTAADTSAAYVYPGGYLNTLKYENMREGIDDHRYIELLDEMLKTAPKDGVRADAELFYKTLEKFLPDYPESGLQTGAEAGETYDESKETSYFGPWREQIAEYITALKENRAARKIEAAWAMFPKTLTAEARTVVCKLVDKGPAVLNGKGDDPAWKDAPEVSDFLDLALKRRAKVQTKVKVLCDGEKLYFHFTCLEPKFGELKAYAVDRDGDAWMDDAVEIFLDYTHQKQHYKQLVVNCIGTVLDGADRDPLWNGDVQTAVSKGKGFWNVEISVTLKSLEAEVPKEGTTWGINLCRDRQPQPPETSSWAWVGTSFHNPAGFGTMEFKK